MSHFESVAEETKHHELLAADEVHAGEHVHVSPFWPMTIVFLVLLVFTVITALTAHYIYLGNKWNLIIALLIACTKATLVFAYFMHLRYDKPINTVVVASSLFAVVLFIGFTLTDTGSRRVPNNVDSQYIAPGGRSHYVRNAEGRLERQNLAAGVVKKAQDDAIAAHAAGAGHGEAPAPAHGGAPAAPDAAHESKPAAPAGGH